MKSRTKFSHTGIMTIFLLIMVQVQYLNTAAAQCCDQPLFGWEDESLGGCQLPCYTKMIALAKQEMKSSSEARIFLSYVKHSANIILEDIPDIVHLDSLTAISFNGTGPLIRIRNTNVSEDSFLNLTSIVVENILDYCSAGTFFDIDYMHPTPLKYLQNLDETFLLEPCSKAKFPFKKLNADDEDEMGKCNLIVAVVSTSIATSLFWLLIILLLYILFVSGMRKKNKKLVEVEKIVKDLVTGTDFLAIRVHHLLVQNLQNHCFLAANLSDIFPMQAYYDNFEAAYGNLKNAMNRHKTYERCFEISYQDFSVWMTHYEPPFKPDPIAYSMGGGKAEKLQKKHEEEAEKGKTKTTVNETVDILTFEYPSRVGSGENRGKAGVESKPLGANPIGPTPSKELSDSTHPLRNFKAEDDGFRMNVVNGMKKLEAGQGIDKTLGRMWMHLGLIKCLIAEQENQCELHEKVLTSSLISLSQLVAIERLERLGVNTRTAYAGLVDRTGKPVHAVKDMHEFYHLLQRLRVEARPEDKKLLELLEKHDLRRRFELMEVGEQYEDNVGKLIFLPPAFTIKDGFLSMIEKYEEIGKDYDEAKNLVDKYAKKNKIELRQKPATSTKVLKFKNVVQDLPMVALKNQPETPQKRTAYTTIRSLEKIVNPKTLLEKTETIVNETKTPREATPKTAVTKEETAFPSREAVTQQTVSGTKDVENLREAETQNEIETQRTTQQTTQQETTIEKTK